VGWFISKVLSNGKIIEYIQTILPNNVLCIIPKSDGNISKHDTIQDYRDIDWDTHIQPYIDYAEKIITFLSLARWHRLEKKIIIMFIYR